MKGEVLLFCSCGEVDRVGEVGYVELGWVEYGCCLKLDMVIGFVFGWIKMGFVMGKCFGLVRLLRVKICVCDRGN